MTAAKEWAKRREVEIKEKPHLSASESQKHSVADAIDRYLREIVPQKAPASQEKDQQRLSWWREHYGRCSLAAFTAPVISEARSELKTTPVQRHGQKRPGKLRTGPTVNRYVAAIRHVLRIAQKEWHWIDFNAADAVTAYPEGRGRNRYLDDIAGPDGTSELSRLLEACRESSSEYLYEAVLLSLHTGGRRNEIMQLRWEDVDEKTVRLSGQKTQRPRRIAVSEALLKQLRRRSGAARALVFPSQKDENKPANLEAAWQGALKRAGIEGFRWHDLRHTAASYLAMEGASPVEIAAVLGHAGLQLVTRYSHLSDDHVAQVATRIGGRIHG
jgi:integrase